jgi:YfiH family protein
MLVAEQRGGLDLIVVPELERSLGITVAFTGRRGGNGSPPFDSLNLAYDVGEERDVVRSNRNLVGNILGISPDDWVLCQQVHGSRVMHAGELERGRGGPDYWSAIPRTDGLVSCTEGLALGILTADCLPLVMVCASEKAAGVAHVGWRGALYGVAVSALHRLLGYSGCNAGEIYAFLGPCIGHCCLKVGKDVAADFRRFAGDNAVTGSEDGNSRLDLASICRNQLIESGVNVNNIFTADVCTNCDEKYFSYRGSGGNTGRQAGMVAIL